MTSIPQFGKQESLESSKESWNQTRFYKDLESHQRKSVVLDLSVCMHRVVRFIVLQQCIK